MAAVVLQEGMIAGIYTSKYFRSITVPVSGQVDVSTYLSDTAYSPAVSVCNTLISIMRSFVGEENKGASARRVGLSESKHLMDSATALYHLSLVAIAWKKTTAQFTNLEVASAGI